MAKVNVSLTEFFIAPANVPVAVESVLINSQSVVSGLSGILPGRKVLRTSGFGVAQFDLMTGRYRVSAVSSQASGGLAYSVLIDVPDSNLEFDHVTLIVSGADAFVVSISETAQILQWAVGEIYRLTNIQWDSDEVITTADVYWPDGSPGVFTVTVKNTLFSDYDAFTITHAASGKTVTQPAYTRDVNGKVTIVPAMTIA